MTDEPLYTVPWLPQLDRFKDPSRRQAPGICMQVAQCAFWTSCRDQGLSVEELVATVVAEMDVPVELAIAGVGFAQMLGMFVVLAPARPGDA